MSAGNLTLQIEQGATFSRTLTIKDYTGTVIDLTGYTFTGKIRALADGKTVAGTFVFTIPTQTGGNIGKVTMVISSTNTALIPADEQTTPTKIKKQYSYDVLMNTGAVIYRLFEGLAEVSPVDTR